MDVSPQAPPLQANQPHSEQHGSVEAKMVTRVLHMHALYHDDNSAVFYHLEEAACGTTYAASIKMQGWVRGLEDIDDSICRTWQMGGGDKVPG